MLAIAKHEFPKLDGVPCSYNLGFKKGNDFDSSIRGWTRYWNEVFRPTMPLDPNLVKALVATESGFNPKAATRVKSASKQAVGLIQLTGDTVNILKDEKGELKNFYVNITEKDRFSADLNLAAGIRWLFRKYEIAHVRSEAATWLSVIALYKGYPLNHPQIKKLAGLYETLQRKCSP